MSISFPRVGMFSAILYLWICFLPLSLFILWGPFYTYTGPLMVSQKSLKLSSLFLILFSFYFSLWMNYTALSMNLLMLFAAWSRLLLNSCWIFLIRFLCSPALWFLLGTFKNIFYLLLKFCLFMYCSQWVAIWPLFWTFYLINHLYPFH